MTSRLFLYFETVSHYFMISTLIYLLFQDIISCYWLLPFILRLSVSLYEWVSHNFKIVSHFLTLILLPNLFWFSKLIFCDSNLLMSNNELASNNELLSLSALTVQHALCSSTDLFSCSLTHKWQEGKSAQVTRKWHSRQGQAKGLCILLTWVLSSRQNSFSVRGS